MIQISVKNYLKYHKNAIRPTMANMSSNIITSQRGQTKPSDWPRERRRRPKLIINKKSIIYNCIKS